MPSIKRQEPGDGSKDCGLTGAIRADERNNFTRGNSNGRIDRERATRYNDMRIKTLHGAAEFG
jgi:hypothetical protein